MQVNSHRKGGRTVRVIFHDRSFLIHCTYTTLAAFLAWSMAAAVPSTVRAAELPLGLATGSKEAHMATDGKQWTSLPGSSSPVYEGTMIRTGKGTASLLLKDGTQLELQPRTVVGLSGSRTAPVVKIAVGRVFFRVPVTSQTALVTPSVRYQATASNQQEGAAIVRAAASAPLSTDLVGEIVVNPRGGSRVGLQKGEMLANSVSDPGLHIIKTGQSVYIPKVGPSDPSFGIMLAQAPPLPEPSGLPVDAIAVYYENGKSVGYITADGSYVSSAGITPNLPNPVPAGTIPPDANIPPNATPIFTAHPAYAGYILNDKLVAYIPLGGGSLAGVGVGAAGTGAGTGVTVGTLVTLGVIGAGVGLGVAFSGDDDNDKSSPSAP